MRILITEDDDAVAEALEVALGRAGYAVDRVSNGAEADEALKQDVFGVLIHDLGLPKLDGFEVLKRLRRRNATLPVLILSGREQSEHKVMGLDLGADDYLVKPFSMNELLARVAAARRHRDDRGSAIRTAHFRYRRAHGFCRWLYGGTLDTRNGRTRSSPPPLRPCPEQGAARRTALQL